jgi:tetratricopeptide (TPR) repeat protein
MVSYETKNDLNLIIRLINALLGEHDSTVPYYIYQEFGTVFRVHNRINEAREFYERALRNVNKPEDKSYILNSLGTISLETGNGKKAKEDFEHAKKFCEYHNIAGSIYASILINLANAANLLGNEEEQYAILTEVAKMNDPDVYYCTIDAQVTLAYLANKNGNINYAKEVISKLKPSDFSKETLAIYYDLIKCFFMESPNINLTLGEITKDLKFAMLNPKQHLQYIEIFNNSNVPLAIIVDTYDNLIKTLNCQQSNIGPELLYLLYQTAMLRRDGYSAAKISLLLLTNLKDSDPIKLIDVFNGASNLLFGVQSHELQLLHFKVLSSLGHQHLKNNTVDREHALFAAKNAWENAINIASSFRLQDYVQEINGNLSYLHFLLGTVYSELAKLGIKNTKNTSIYHFKRADQLLPKDNATDDLKQMIANNLSNIMISDVDESNLSEIINILNKHKAILLTIQGDSLEKCILNMNIAQDYLELAEYDTSDKLSHLEYANSYLTEAQKILVRIDNPPIDLKFGIQVMAVKIANESKLSTIQLSAVAQELDKNLYLTKTITNNIIISSAYLASAKAADLIKIGRHSVYRRLLQGIRLLRAKAPFTEIFNRFVNTLIDYLLKWGHTSRAIYFINLQLCTLEEEPYSFPMYHIKNIKSSETILFWYFCQDSWIFIINNKGIQCRLLEITPQQVVDLNKNWLNFRENYSNKNDADSFDTNWKDGIGTIGQTLGQYFFSAIIDLLPTSGTIYLVPNPLVRLLPLHLASLLSSDGIIRNINQFLSITYGRNIAFNQKSNFIRRSGTFAACDSPPQASIPFTILETLGVSYAHGPKTNIAINNITIPADILDGIKNNDVIHLACHGTYNHGQPLDSKLHFSGNSISLRDIQLSLTKLSCRLIILSACEGGVDLRLQENDAGGFVPVLLRAGCHEIIAALWKVNDIATSFLMIYLHKMLAEGNTPAISLSLAQNWVRTTNGSQLYKLGTVWLDHCRTYLKQHEIELINKYLSSINNDSLYPFKHPVYWGSFFTTVNRIYLPNLVC